MANLELITVLKSQVPRWHIIDYQKITTRMLKRWWSIVDVDQSWSTSYSTNVSTKKYFTNVSTKKCQQLGKKYSTRQGGQILHQTHWWSLTSTSTSEVATVTPPTSTTSENTPPMLIIYNMLLLVTRHDMPNSPHKDQWMWMLVFTILL